ncbi:MAG: HAMP domain-containing sensor histidine kinase [Campylobacterota bacterium]|nr:HAMP domain-containing sensor histidine kinase [Campylobacterota bacterium]
MKKFELESLLKSFLIFFLLQEILLSVIMWQNYQNGIRNIDDKIKSQMKVCSFDLKCEGLELDFVPATSEREIRRLYKEVDVYSYFKVPTADNYLMKVVLSGKKHKEKIDTLKKEIALDFLLYSFVIALLSLLLSFYALFPLKKALKLNEEFVKDILHDFNTPIASMIINFKLFKKEIGSNKKIDRIENNIETLLRLQNNLQTFLKGIETQQEQFNLEDLLKKRVAYFQVLYPTIDYTVHPSTIILKSNKDAFVRIIDNILSNAGKYNISNGKVEVTTEGSRLIVSDTGIGIKEPKQVYDRFYTERERGIGIGMHIVKKLCDALDIIIDLKSEVGAGTQVILDLQRVIVR